MGTSRVAKPWPEEPYAVVPHVRVCGGPGWATTQVYPAVLGRYPRESTGGGSSQRLWNGVGSLPDNRAGGGLPRLRRPADHGFGVGCGQGLGRLYGPWCRDLTARLLPDTNILSRICRSARAAYFNGLAFFTSSSLPWISFSLSLGRSRTMSRPPARAGVPAATGG